MPRKILVLLSLVSLLTTFRTRLVMVQWAQAGWAAVPARLPGRPPAPDPASDLDSDGQPERIELRDGILSVLRGDEMIWSSPPEWDVRRAQIADLNRDGRPEVTMLVWRPFAPWPIDEWVPHGGRIAEFHDAQNRSCHIILWGWARDGYRELWAGSALAEPILDYYAADWNGDGRQELAAVEMEYDHPPQGRALALWEWNGFGFTIQGRMTVGIGNFAFLINGEDGRPSVLFNPAF
jgi:hypothetical protein